MKVNSIVTWGSGEPVARVVEVYHAFNKELGIRDLFARVELVKPVASPCGKTFPVGLLAEMPTADLRHLS